MRAQNRPLLAVGSLLLVFPVLSGAVTATFEKIADTSTLMPAGLNPDEPFTQLNKLHALGAGTVTFSGRTANRFGMYNRSPSPPFPPPLVPLAQNQLALPPAGTGQYAFDSFGHISADGGQVAFGAAFLGGNTGGLAILTGSPGALNVVATAATLMPGYTHNFGSFNDISLRSGQIVWRSQSQFGSGETGVYSSSGGVHAVALPGDAVPGLPGGTFTALNNFPTVVTDGSDIVFQANSSSPSVFSHNGIYKSSGGVLSMVVDSNTSRPGAPLEKFAGPYRLTMHQGTIAFAGEWADLTAFPVVRTSGVYTISSGVHTIADTHMLAPGIGTPFTMFSDNDGPDGGGVSIHDDVVAFVAYTGQCCSWVNGMYVSSGGGPAEKLIAKGDSLGGKTIRDLSIRRESLAANPKGGYSLAFWVQFTDLSQAIYRADFGAPVRQAIAGASSIAVLRQGSILVEMRDPLDGSPVGTLSFLSDAYAPISAAALPDSDGNGVAELAVLAKRISDGRPVVQIRNVSGPAATRSIFFAAETNPIALSVITGDADNNGIAEIAVLSTRNSDGRGRVDIRNAFGPANLQIVYASAGFAPLGLEVIGDADGNGVPEVAILSTRNSNGQTRVETVNAAGTPNRTTINFQSGATAVDFAIVSDADGNAIPEIAVLSSRNSDERGKVEIRNAAGAPNTVIRWLAVGQTPLAVVAVADADGNSVPEVAALSSRNSDGKIAVDVSNAAGAAELNRVWYSAGFSARSLAILEDLDGNNVPEMAVVMIRDSDGRILVQSRNAAGSQAATNYWFSP